MVNFRCNVRPTSISFQRLAERLFRRIGRKQGLSLDGHTFIPKPKKLGEHFGEWVQTPRTDRIATCVAGKIQPPLPLATQPRSGACEPDWLCTCNALHTRRARHKTVGHFCWCGLEVCTTKPTPENDRTDETARRGESAPSKAKRRVNLHQHYPRSNYRDGVPLEHTCDGGLFLNEQDRSHRNRLHVTRNSTSISSRTHAKRTQTGFGPKETDSFRFQARKHPVPDLSALDLDRPVDTVALRRQSQAKGIPEQGCPNVVKQHGWFPCKGPKMEYLCHRETENDCPLTSGCGIKNHPVCRGPQSALRCLIATDGNVVPRIQRTTVFLFFLTLGATTHYEAPCE